MPSIPLTADEERKILGTLGIQSIEDLFSAIPPRIRENSELALSTGSRGLTEHELREYFSGLASQNASSPKFRHFLGGGYYDNVIPAIVNQLVLRGEFLTCYTPYQPEMSQGTLQAIFEFQTMMSRLTAMPVANASMYDGHTAAAEAALMAGRLCPDKKGVLLASSVHPETKEVIKTFLKYSDHSVFDLPWTSDGQINLDVLTAAIKEHNPCCVLVGSPNYFGIIEPLEEIKRRINGCLFIVSVSDASALSLFEPPGNFGADIVVGEAHQLGTPVLFGGPHVGFFATRKEHIRQMPGRLCGETASGDKKAYTLTLSTREQHIRREKATSNICTNQGLIALRTTIYLSFLGKKGFEQLGVTNLSLFEYLVKEMESIGMPLKFKGPRYREGVFEIPNLEKRFEAALKKNILPGIRLEKKFGPEFSRALLICTHPKLRKSDIDELVEVLSHDH